MSIQKVKTRSGEIRWEVRYRLNGRDSKRLRRRFQTKIDAETFYADYTLEKKKNGWESLGIDQYEDTTFAKEADYWIATQGIHFAEAHAKNAKHFLSKLLPKYGHLKPEKFHPGLLTEIQSKLLKNGLKPSSVNRYFQVVRAILNYSVKQRRIPRDPSKGFELLKEVRDDIGFLEKSEASDFLHFANQKYPSGSEKRWVFVVYLFAVNTAARAGEIWGLKPADIKDSGEIIHIQRQYNRVKLEYSPTKGKKNRRVPCSELLFKELTALIESRRIGDQEPLFQTESGGPIHHDNFVKRSFKRDLSEWGGKSIRFHDLRHTATTLMIASGLDIKTVQEICGHQSVQTTMTYVHLLAERIRDARKIYMIEPQAEALSLQSKCVGVR